MSKKEKEEMFEVEKDLEQMKKEIEQKGKEIEQMKKMMEEMKTKIQGKEKTGETGELGKIFDDVSQLLDVSFNIFGTSGKIQGKKSKGKGLFSLINDLNQLTEKSETYQKRMKLGEKGVVDFRVRSGPLRRPSATKPISNLKISKPKKETSQMQTQTIQTDSTIKDKEPIVDVFEEKDHIRVLVELPGIKENEINLDIENNTLTIRTNNPTRKYFKKIDLLTLVKKDTVKSTYKNGILEVKLKKTKKDA